MTNHNENLQKMMGWVFGYQISQAIYVACKLKIADALNEKPLSIHELSTTIHCHEQSLNRLLKALTSIGIFHEVSPTVYAQNDLSQLLSSSAPNTIYASVLLYGGLQYQMWGDLTHSVVTGESAFYHKHQTDFFSFLNQHTELADLFKQCLTNNSSARAKKALDYYDFSSIKKVIDVGGGNGSWLAEILDNYNHLTGIVIDTKETIQNCKQTNLELSIKYNDRISFKEGDFFESILSSGDLYFLSHILHDWNDEKAQIILNNCRRSMSAEGKLLLVERILLPENKLDYGKWMDLNMLVMLNGQERTLEQYKNLLSSSGFKLSRTISTPVGLDLIEAIPV